MKKETSIFFYPLITIGIIILYIISYVFFHENVHFPRRKIKQFNFKKNLKSLILLFDNLFNLFNNSTDQQKNLRFFFSLKLLDFKEVK